MCYNCLHTDPYEHVGKIHKKEKKSNHLYIANPPPPPPHTHTHNYILIKKKKRKKHTPVNSSLFT